MTVDETGNAVNPESSWYARLERPDRVAPPKRPNIKVGRHSSVGRLSDLQLHYLWLTLHGYSGRAIAEAAQRSAQAVNSQLRRAVETLGARDKHDAARMAFGYDSNAAPIQASEEEFRSTDWTGQYTIQDRIRIVRTAVPAMMSEIDILIDITESRRFNDPETHQALGLLRSLHGDLGALIQAVEDRQDRSLLHQIGRKNQKLLGLVASGAKIGIAAPALTVGISHLLSALTNVPIDSTMISTVFASMVAVPLAEKAMTEKGNKGRGQSP